MLEFCRRFTEIERSEKLFRRCIGGVLHWHLIRYWFFNDLVVPRFMDFGTAHPDDLCAPAAGRSLSALIAAKLRRGCRMTLDKTLCNPSLALKRREILFAMTPRTASFGDGSEGSVLLDFITPRLKSTYALFEHGRSCGYTRQPFSRKVFHLPEMRARRGRMFSEDGVFAAATGERKEEAGRLAEIFERAYGFEFEAGRIWWMIDEVLRFRTVYFEPFKKWLERLGVRVLVTGVPEVKENAVLTEAAHAAGVPVVELQHGTIHPDHMVYRLGERESVYSPDYLLTWGDHWNEQLLNYPNGRAVSVGYPFLEHFAKKCPHRRRMAGEALRVLFISQGGVAAELTRTAVDMAKVFPRDVCAVTYKLHPNETKTWREIYPWLIDSGVAVVANDEKNIFECLQHADVTVGSSSTSLIEGLAWGVRSLVLKWLPGSEIMSAFTGSGAVEFIGNANALTARIGELAASPENDSAIAFDPSGYWVPDAAENIASFLDSLASNGAIA